MVFSVQTWWHVTWRPTVIWASFNKQNRRKLSKNSRCNNVWSSSNNRWVGSIDWSFVDLMSTNFNRRTSHEMSCCKIRSSLALRVHWVCGSFSRKTGWQRLRTPPTPRTWHPAIFSCFQEWRGTLKESVFRMWRRWGKKRRRHWRLSLCKSSRTVLNYGKSGGIIVLIRKESILKVIKFWKCSEKYTIFKKSRYFWVPPRIFVRF